MTDNRYFDDCCHYECNEYYRLRQRIHYTVRKTTITKINRTVANEPAKCNTTIITTIAQKASLLFKILCWSECVSAATSRALAY